MKRILVIAFSIITFSLIGCSEDKSTEPSSDNGGDNGEEILMSGFNASEWSGSVTEDWDTGSCGSSYHRDMELSHACRGDNLRAVNNAWNCGDNECGGDPERTYISITSIEKFDFTSYSQARFKCKIEGKTSYTYGDLRIGDIKIKVISNVPGVDDLTLYDALGNFDSGEDEDLNVSLQSALDFTEATVNFYVFCGTYMSSHQCPDNSITISEFSIVATK